VRDTGEEEAVLSAVEEGFAGQRLFGCCEAYEGGRNGF